MSLNPSNKQNPFAPLTLVLVTFEALTFIANPSPSFRRKLPSILIDFAFCWPWLLVTFIKAQRKWPKRVLEFAFNFFRSAKKPGTSGSSPSESYEQGIMHEEIIREHEESINEDINEDGQSEMSETVLKKQSWMSEEDWAYECVSSCNSKIESGDKNFQKDGRISVKFYRQDPNQYYEELITVKNNMAFGHAKNRNYKAAIQLLKEVIALEERFFSLRDERKLATLNNLFCAYCLNQQKEEAAKLWVSVVPILEESEIDSGIKQIFIRSHLKYLPDICSTE